MHPSDGYYIKMKLGDPPQKFHFTIDTGSKHTWVYCKVSGHESKLGSLVSASVCKLSNKFQVLISMLLAMDIVIASSLE